MHENAIMKPVILYAHFKKEYTKWSFTFVDSPSKGEQLVSKQAQEWRTVLSAFSASYLGGWTGGYLEPGDGSKSGQHKDTSSKAKKSSSCPLMSRIPFSMYSILQ